MKAILYFVAAGVVLPRHTEAAKVINGTTSKRVVFRNADTGLSEKPEANEGVAGKVPANYAEFTAYDDNGKAIGTKGAGTPADPVASTDTGTAPERKLNELGVPDEDGAPTDRESLKASLEAEGVEFHANASTEKLVALYIAHFYPQG